jgi:hypothetical protein
MVQLPLKTLHINNPITMRKTIRRFKEPAPDAGRRMMRIIRFCSVSVFLLPSGCLADPAWQSTGPHAVATHSADLDSFLTDTATTAIYTTQNHAAARYVRNPTCWIVQMGLNLTCHSPWNSQGHTTRPVTLISPDVFIAAAHYMPGTGSLVRFVTEDDRVIERT